MSAKAVVRALHELIAVIEAGNVAVTRYAAAGDATDVIVTFRVVACGHELITAINNPLATARQRMLNVPSPQLTLEALETGDENA